MRGVIGFISMWRASEDMGRGKEAKQPMSAVLSPVVLLIERKGGREEEGGIGDGRRGTGGWWGGEVGGSHAVHRDYELL